MPCEIMVGLVAPFHDNAIRRQFWHEFGMMNDNVAPKHHAITAFGDIGIEFLEPIDVNTSASALGFFFALALPQFPRLITANIELFAGKVGQKLIIEFLVE